MTRRVRTNDAPGAVARLLAADAAYLMGEGE